MARRQRRSTDKIQTKERAPGHIPLSERPTQPINTKPPKQWRSRFQPKTGEGQPTDSQREPAQRERTREERDRRVLSYRMLLGRRLTASEAPTAREKRIIKSERPMRAIKSPPPENWRVRGELKTPPQNPTDSPTTPARRDSDPLSPEPPDDRED